MESTERKNIRRTNGSQDYMEDVDEDESESDSNNNNDNGAGGVAETVIRIPHFSVAEYEAGLVTRYDEVIDVRTPLEFAEDRIPGAVNWPVLSNEERATVGTLYARWQHHFTIIAATDTFNFARDKMAGRRLGAALISRNISDHIINNLEKKSGNDNFNVLCLIFNNQ